MSRTLFYLFRMIYDKQIVIDYYNEVGLTLLPEFTFSNDHGYRFDFLHSPSKVAIEVMGGIWLAKGGHTTGAGYLRDMAKENLALSLGYRVFKCVPSDLCMDDTRALFAKIVEVASAHTKSTIGPVAAGGSVFSRGSDVDVDKDPQRRSKKGRTRTVSDRPRLPA